MTPQRLIYLDNNATTACAPEVVQAMLPFLADQYGNPSSVHLAGRVAFRAVEDAREKMAFLLSTGKHEIFFNSGATEGNNWIFQAFAQLPNQNRKRIVVNAIEHKSVLDTAIRLRRFGYDVQLLPVTADGVVDVSQAADIITRETALVSVQYANNETGVVQPITELVELAHRAGAFFHCDAVQGLGKAQLNLTELPVDSATFSGHKIHAPKGVGVLYIRGGARNWQWEYPLAGGGQEHNIRPGTYNVPGIVGLGKAAELLHADLSSHISYMATLRNSLETQLKSRLPDCLIHGEQAPRIPNTSNVTIKGIPADILMSTLPNICVSAGSACNGYALTPSHVLTAMGCSIEDNRQSLRISFCRYNSCDDVNQFVEAVANAYHTLPKM